jgi:uncharacterized membrane protein YhaH (DUF805 family)
MANLYCVNCGGAVDGVAFCAVCGTAVAGAAPAGAPAQPSSAPYSAPTSNAASSGKTLQTGQLSFVDAIRSFFANYVNFEGRATQSAYWYAALFLFLLGTAASILGRGMGDQFGSNPLSSLISLATLLPNISVGIRRLHDTGRSGAYLFWALLPIVGWILLIVWLAAGSHAQDNKYGPRP